MVDGGGKCFQGSKGGGEKKKGERDLVDMEAKEPFLGNNVDDLGV